MHQNVFSNRYDGLKHAFLLARGKLSKLLMAANTELTMETRAYYVTAMYEEHLMISYLI